MPQKIVLVTGANKGIGFEICRQLAGKGLAVIMTSRNQERGMKAAEQLKRQDLLVDFHLLDVTDSASIKALERYLETKHDRLDVLINNAGIFIDDEMDSLNVDMDTVRKTFETNFIGPFLVSQVMLPLLKKSDDGRIINISSGLGQLSDTGSGFPSYSMSKAALNMLSAKMAADLKGTKIKVNSICPGWIKTDMGGKEAPGTVEEGADTAVWLATASQIPNGKFLRNRKVIDW